MIRESQILPSVGKPRGTGGVVSGTLNSPRAKIKEGPYTPYSIALVKAHRIQGLQFVDKN